MIHFSLQRVAGLTALLGGILQATLLFLQIDKLGEVLKGRYHVTWDWNIPREYRWISVSPWLFFLIALLCLHWYVAPRLRWPIWKGTLAILLPIIAITLPEIAQAFITDCVPNLPCNPGNRLIPLFLTSVSVIGTLSLSVSLLTLGKALTYTPFSLTWLFIHFFIALLAFQTCVVAVDVGAWVPGYFKIDLLSMVPGLLLAAIWCFIGWMFCFKAFPPLQELASQT